VAAELADVEPVRDGCIENSAESGGESDADDSQPMRTADAIIDRYLKHPGLLA
jgi:hypothetical protein